MKGESLPLGIKIYALVALVLFGISFIAFIYYFIKYYNINEICNDYSISINKNEKEFRRLKSIRNSYSKKMLISILMIFGMPISAGIFKDLYFFFK